MDLLVDKEAGAIQSIISSLAADEQRRVMAYVNLRYGKNGATQHEKSETTDTTDSGTAAMEHSDVATLFEQAKPQSCSERALVAGYWFQIGKAQKDFESRALTRVVAELGHPTKNITRDVRALLGATPKLMIQVGKGSSTGSHRYRLTTEGIKSVQNMIAGKRS